MIKTKWALSLVAVSFMLVNSATAAVSVQQAEKLKNELTPFGGTRAGNGTDIPPWRGGLTLPPLSYQKTGQHHPDPYPQDKRLFTITAKNMAKYDKYLSEGTKALLKTYPKTFKLPIYKTRRTAAAPEWVYENTYKNAIRAELTKDGNGINYAFGGIPFPIAKTGTEMVWNHITRWRGTHLSRRASEVAVQTNGNYSLVTVQQEIKFNYYDPSSSIEKLDNRLFQYLSFTKAPARLAGGAVLVHDPLNQVEDDRQAWGYNAGQRRVRRAPNLSYDTPIAAADGLRFADDTDMFNGAPDRFNWRFKGMREVYIPYNSYKTTSNTLKYDDLLMPGHVNPQHIRYEKHRVYVVEGTLKPGMRHSYQKRRFYIDEDTWGIVLADMYDKSGDLYRTSMAVTKSYYEVPATLNSLDVFLDLKAKRYHVQGLDNEERSTVDFSTDMPGDRYFTPAELRRRGRR